MPWRLFESLPFINSAQAVRFTVFVDLILAIIVAMWIAEAKLRGGAKIAIAMVIIFSIMPNVLDQSLWATDSHLPEFITSGTFRDYLRPDENVLVLPFGPQGNAMVWQTLSGMYFAMPEGWTGPTPPSFAAWPIMDVFAYGIDIPGKQTQFNAFMGAHGATAVVIDRNSPDAAKWMDLIDPASAQVQKLVEVIIARPSAEALARFKAATATAMQCRRDEVRLPAVIAAAAGYIKGGYPLDQLTPRAAEDRGLLPPAWVEANDGATFARSGIALGSADGDRVMVGVKTAAGCAKAFVEKYGPEAAEIRFPYPRIWGAKKLPDSHDGRFVLILSRYGLARAAASLHSTAHQARTH